jgi:hypothetical protein
MSFGKRFAGGVSLRLSVRFMVLLWTGPSTALRFSEVNGTARLTYRHSCFAGRLSIAGRIGKLITATLKTMRAVPRPVSFLEGLGTIKECMVII